MVVTWDGGAEISADEVRRRVLWARRQGRPAWLWPDTPIAAWRGALTGIERAITAVLAGEGVPTLEGEPASLGLAGYTSGMGPLLGLWIEQGRLRAGPVVAELLAGHLAHNRARAKQMTAAGVQVVGQLADCGIRTVVLKGAHTGAAYFPEAGARPASDIDLLVAAGDAPGAEAVLGGCGLVLKGRSRWETTWVDPSLATAPRSLTYVHAEDPWSIDLHSSLNISAGPGAALADLDLGDPLAGADRWAVDLRAGVLDPPLLLLHLATHAGTGWHNLTLLRQVELVLVIRQERASGRLCWDGFLQVGARTGALGYAYPALRLANRLAPGTVPAAVLEACATRAPAAVRRALSGLTPATAQRIDRNSVHEHFMWAQGFRGRLRFLGADLVLAGRSWAQLAQIYEDRAWRLIRGTLSQ